MADRNIAAEYGSPFTVANIGLHESSNNYTIGATTTAPTPGTNTRYRRTIRDGEYAIIRWEFFQTVAGSAGSGNYLLPLPSGLTIDSSKISVGVGFNNDTANCGTGILSTATSSNNAFAFAVTNTSVGVIFDNQGATGASGVSWSSTNRPLSTSVVLCVMEARLPILEWSGQTHSSNGMGLVTSTKPGAVPATSTLGRVRLANANAYGSTFTTIRRFGVLVENVGTDITYVDSPTLGASFTIVNAGLYAMSYGDQFNAAGNVGISKNIANGAGGITVVSQADRLAYGTSSAANYVMPVAVTVFLNAGDVIRPHADSTPGGLNPALSFFSIQRLS